MDSFSTLMGSTKFKHVPLTQKTPSIRLITVLPDVSEDGLLQCRVIHASLPPPFIPPDEVDGEPPATEGLNHASVVLEEKGAEDIYMPYSCVSYTWGDPSEEYAILVNDKLFIVRSNLWAFLNMATRSLHNTLLWIDALCIDQTNTTERNHQVQQMGNVFSRAKSVYAWLGNDMVLASILYTVTKSDLGRDSLTDTANLGARVPLSRASTGSHDGAQLSINWQFSIFQDSTGKVEKFLERITKHEYWGRAWVTQEVLLAKQTILVVGSVTCNILSLATKYRAAVPHVHEGPFENIVDILLKQQHMKNLSSDLGLKTWGVVNVLHHFRDKKCAIRRDRIYSLLGLSTEGKNLAVDYNVSEEHLVRQVLSLRKRSMCFCSAAVVSHALSPWYFPSNETTVEVDKTPFVETQMYACSLSSAVCPFCSNWVPFSWTRKKGLLFCMGTACADTQGHLFWEQTTSAEDSSPREEKLPQTLSSIFVQARQNNKSQLLCREGAGIEIQQSEWRNVYLLRFTFRFLVEMLQVELTTTDRGLNACETLWPSASSGVGSGEGRLRFCS
ncbi:hypothetical protein N0V83_009002 [Neocucurbitaria cava]|uniref:Heterokaryon incompatibility domain-containing protein n=1 Tax=Neocucurbitaria cava TaxID=798079 RepID=A0A9W9CII4_9PLEO|nr:hypothetical protein N0V83_009002 [Neocucurbitaria cava]